MVAAGLYSVYILPFILLHTLLRKSFAPKYTVFHHQIFSVYPYFAALSAFTSALSGLGDRVQGPVMCVVCVVCLKCCFFHFPVLTSLLSNSFIPFFRTFFPSVFALCRFYFRRLFVRPDHAPRLSPLQGVQREDRRARAVPHTAPVLRSVR